MIEFSKYHGLGNDFIVIPEVEIANQQIKDIFSALNIQRICNRRTGIGADGVIISSLSRNDDIRMRIFNSDGTEAEMCGNGIRCLIKHLSDNDIIKLNQIVNVETLAGSIQGSIDAIGNITVDMGVPTFIPSEIPTKLNINNLDIPEEVIKLGGNEYKIYGVGMGNPHMVVYVPTLKKLPLDEWGPNLESHPNFPSGTNVHFVHIVSRDYLEVLVWERGCGATMACGTGACACLAVTSSLGLCANKVTINLPGGNLEINWPDRTSNILMTGPSTYVYSGRFDPNSLA